MCKIPDHIQVGVGCVNRVFGTANRSNRGFSQIEIITAEGRFFFFSLLQRRSIVPGSQGPCFRGYTLAVPEEGDLVIFLQTEGENVVWGFFDEFEAAHSAATSVPVVNQKAPVEGDILKFPSTEAPPEAFAFNAGGRNWGKKARQFFSPSTTQRVWSSR